MGHSELVTLWLYLHTFLQSLHPNTRCRHTRSSVRWSGPSHRDCGTCSCRSDRCLSARHQCQNPQISRCHTAPQHRTAANTLLHIRHTPTHTQPKAIYTVELHAIQNSTENELRIPEFEMSQQTGWSLDELDEVYGRIKF